MRRVSFCVLVVWVALWIVAPSWASSYSFSESLSSNPFASSGGNWFVSTAPGLSPDTYSQFTWDSLASSKYTGDPVGSLKVAYDSQKPTVRLERPLPLALSMDRYFSLGTRMTIRSQDFAASPDDYFEMTFGLVSHAGTGAKRTDSYVPASGSWLSDADVFHNVEFSYFPNVAFWGGPTLQCVAMGSHVPGSDAFGNFASPNYLDGDLGGNTGSQITSLPLDTPLDVDLAYNAHTQLLTLTVSRVNADGSLTQLLLSPTGVITADLSGNSSSGGNNFDKSRPFSVDSLVVTSYFDNGDYDLSTQSLFARVDFDRFSFQASEVIPEPASLLLLGTGFLGIVGVLRRRACY